jgi:hypothetical protein
VGAVAGAPKAWTSPDGSTWTPVALRATGPYGDRGALVSAACRGTEVVAVGTATGGVHGSPRVSIWRSRAAASWTQLELPVELFGGPSAGSVDRVVAGPGGWVVTGHRISPTTKLRGAAVWLSSDGNHFQLVDDDPELRSARDVSTTVYDAAPGPKGGWVLVGAAGSATAPTPAAWESPDGRTWGRVRVAANGSGAIERVLRYPGWGLLAVGRDIAADVAYAWRASEAQPQTLARLDAACGGRPDAAGNLVTALVTANTRAGPAAVVAVGTGDASKLCASANGASWRELDAPTGLRDDHWLRLAGSGSELLAAAAAPAGDTAASGLWLADLAAVQP